MSLATRVYRRLLAWYPRDYVERYGVEAASVFDRLYVECRARDGRAAAYRLALRLGVRAVAGAVAEWAGAIRPAPRVARRPASPVPGPPNPTDTRSLLSMRHDLKYAFRSLVTRPGFSATVILLLATGIGAATSVFSVVDGVLLRRLPYPDPDRLVFLDEGSHPPADFVDWQTEVTSIATWGGTWYDELDIVGDERPDLIGVGRVTPDLFRVLGARASLGRLFSAEEHVGDPSVAVVSNRYWLDRWGGDPGILGREMRLGDRAATVVGIMAPDFVVPRRLQRGNTAIWVPFDPRHPDYQERGLHVLQVVARLAPGATVEAARIEMEVMNERFAERFPERMNEDGTFVTTPVLSMREAEVGDVRGTLLMLLGAVGLLLGLACVNVANLLLARGADRTRELALRGALGATRRNVLAQLTTEALLLSLAGGAVGVLLAFGGVKLFEILEPGVLPRTDSVGVDIRVLGFALAVSVATGLLFGIVPALRAARVDVSGTLKEGSGQATLGRQRARIQGSLVVSEVALSLVLLTGAGLLFHSFIRLTRVDTGFDPSRLVTVNLQLGSWEPGGDAGGYDAARRTRFVEELMRRLRAVPETRAVVAGVTLPFQYPSGGSCCWAATVTWQGTAEGEGVGTTLHPVMPGFLSALGIPLTSGRDLQPGDERLDPFPVVLGGRTATLLFGDEDPIGRTVSFSSRQGAVVGVVGDVRHNSFDREGRPDLYLPWQVAGADMPLLNIGIRTDLELGAIAPAIRAAVWDLDPNLPIPDIASMEERMSRSVADERFYSVILASFAVVALLLAAGGVYATFLYSVRQRVRELGIRLALGARRADVIRLVMRRGLLLTLTGIVVGLGAAAIGARVLTSMVFGISAHDPLTYAVVSALMAVVALGACLAPALRAGRTDPIETLRAD